MITVHEGDTFKAVSKIIEGQVGLSLRYGATAPKLMVNADRTVIDWNLKSNLLPVLESVELKRRMAYF